MPFLTSLFGRQAEARREKDTHAALRSELLQSMAPCEAGSVLLNMRRQSETALSGAEADWRDRLVTSLGPHHLAELSSELQQYVEMMRRGAKSEGWSDPASECLSWSGATARILVGALTRAFTLSESESNRVQVQSAMATALRHPAWRVRLDASTWLMFHGDRSVLQALGSSSRFSPSFDHSWGNARQTAEQAIAQIQQREGELQERRKELCRALSAVERSRR